MPQGRASRAQSRRAVTQSIAHFKISLPTGVNPRILWDNAVKRTNHRPPVGWMTECLRVDYRVNASTRQISLLLARISTAYSKPLPCQDGQPGAPGPKGPMGPGGPPGEDGKPVENSVDAACGAKLFHVFWAFISANLKDII